MPTSSSGCGARCRSWPSASSTLTQAPLSPSLVRRREFPLHRPISTHSHHSIKHLTCTNTHVPNWCKTISAKPGEVGEGTHRLAAVGAPPAGMSSAGPRPMGGSAPRRGNQLRRRPKGRNKRNRGFMPSVTLVGFLIETQSTVTGPSKRLKSL